MLYTEEAIKNRRNKAQLIRKTISIIIYILLTPLLVYNISLIAQAVTNPNKTPSFLGIKTYTIISGSMEPELKIGDIVIVKEAGKDDIKEQDVISYRHGQSVITHRVIEIHENEGNKTYKTKGDSNNIEDTEEISYSSIEGRMIGRIPFLGKLSRLLQGKVTVVVIALMAYVYFSHLSKMNRVKNRRKVKRLKYEETK
ncbi:MAG: signal peptidase I [Clostridia bacterium]|nr:signal peptidase I [Clostridia bacterium]